MQEDLFGPLGPLLLGGDDVRDWIPSLQAETLQAGLCTAHPSGWQRTRAAPEHKAGHQESCPATVKQVILNSSLHPSEAPSPA